MAATTMNIDDTESHALRALRDLIESGRPLAYVHTAEERRVTSLCREAASKFYSPPAPLWTWTSTEGMRRDGADTGELLNPRATLEFIATHDGPGIFLLKDFHDPMRESPEIRRRLRDLYEVGLGTGKLMVIVSAVKFIPEEI